MQNLFFKASSFSSMKIMDSFVSNLFIFENDVHLGSCFMILQTLFKDFTFWGVNKIFEMSPTHNSIALSAPMGPKTVLWNIGL